ncbi:MAG: glycosyltransferase [Candidatus Thorarchaeota archaeon]
MKSPLISIIVPAYNEENDIQDFLDNIKKIDLFNNSEIIFVDDGSTDNTQNILEKIAKSEENIYYYRLNKNYSVGYARRYAVGKSKGKYIANIDVDATPSNNWLRMIKYLDRDTVAIGFPAFPPGDKDFLDSKFKYIGDGKPEKLDILHGSGTIFKKDVLLEMGNFPDRRFGEDVELFKKIIRNGYHILYSEEARTQCKNRSSGFIGFLKRNFRSGRYSNNICFTLIFLSLLITSILLFIFGEFYLKILSLCLPIGFMLNPLRIYEIYRDFNFPHNKVIKLFTFTLIQFLISISYLAGALYGLIDKIH